MQKVLVGMSGGVDSSVTAYLLKEKGYEVEGVSFILWEAGKRDDFTTCCSLWAVHEASKTARHIGISHSTIDARDVFMEKVITPFIDAYTKGSTPNPCILCNRFIKFPLLLKEAEKRGAEYIATGHYARVGRIQKAGSSGQKAENDIVFLKKGIDPKKDQSYVLYILRQGELKKLILPLGYYRKEEVRKIAQGLNLPSAQRSESQDICFIENRNYFKFIEKLSSVAGKPGPIIDMNGNVIGTHKGIYGYTVGQRKGLGISSPEPFYVVKIDAVRNTVYVGSQENAKKKEFCVKDLNWIIPYTPLIPPFNKGGMGGFDFRASVRVRSMMKDEPATISLVTSNKLEVTSKDQIHNSDLNSLLITRYSSLITVCVVFDEPQWAPAPGQSAVFYDDDRVIGGGVII